MDVDAVVAVVAAAVPAEGGGGVAAAAAPVDIRSRAAIGPCREEAWSPGTTQEQAWKKPSNKAQRGGCVF